MSSPTSSLGSRFRESITRMALRSYLAEFISTFFYVLAVVGSTMSSRKMTPEALVEPSSLVAMGLASAFALSAVVYIASGISGGHVNPAVTFAMAIGGHISVPTALFYWMSQMLASIMASALLKFTTVSETVPAFRITQEMTGFGASILEGILTFALVYTFFAASGVHRQSQGQGQGAVVVRGPEGAIGPMMIGFMAGAGGLAVGPFSGGSMNPACAFGSALIAGSFKNQAVYWVGPLVGATVASLLYDMVMFPSGSTPPDSIRGINTGVGGAGPGV